MNADKDILRKKLLEKYYELHTDYVAMSDKGIFQNITDLPEYANAKTVLIYCCMEREPDTVRITQHALKQGKTVVLPVSLEEGRLEAREMKSFSELVPARHGIPVPKEGARVVPKEEIDIIILPGVAYDMAGYRLGRGGGYYDRYIADYAGPTIGLVREKFLLHELPVEEHDQKVDILVSESRTIRIKKD